MEQLFTEYWDRIYAVFLIVFFAIAIRYAVTMVRQNWIKTFSHTITLILLPLVTYSITSVISGNIALSLGMVGALSIVRFRNPVKSPFELVIYFLMISIGICASVSIEWVKFLGGSSLIILMGTEYLSRLYHYKTGKDLFTASFSEGNSLNVINIETAGAVGALQDHNALIAMSHRDDHFTYRLASSDKAQILELSKFYSGKPETRAIEFNAA
jgi:hypothetical protein